MITQSCTGPILQQEAFIFDMDGVLLDSSMFSGVERFVLWIKPASLWTKLEYW